MLKAARRSEPSKFESITNDGALRTTTELATCSDPYGRRGVTYSRVEPPVQIVLNTPSFPGGQQYPTDLRVFGKAQGLGKQGAKCEPSFQLMLWSCIGNLEQVEHYSLNLSGRYEEVWGCHVGSVVLWIKILILK